MDNSKSNFIELQPEQLIQSALNDTLTAIGGYDAILWKIRTGYLTILYGGLALIFGKEGIKDFGSLISNIGLSFSVFFLILGFSFAGFIVDFGYLRKKLKVIVCRDLLIGIVLNNNSELKNHYKVLLEITGEADVNSFPDDGKDEYIKKRNWNLKWILLPLYATTPGVFAIIYLFYKTLL